MQVHIHNILTAVFLLLLSLVASSVMPFSKSFLRVKDCAVTQRRLLGITTDNLSRDIWVILLAYPPVCVIWVLSWALYRKVLLLETGQLQICRIQHVCFSPSFYYLQLFSFFHLLFYKPSMLEWLKCQHFKWAITGIF